MSRHRSPSGRRAPHGFPLVALSATAGAGGAHRPRNLTGSLTARVVATVVAGGAVAATGHAVYSALPADDGLAVLHTGDVTAPAGAPAPAAPVGSPATGSPVTGTDVAALAGAPAVPASDAFVKSVAADGAGGIRAAQLQFDALQKTEQAVKAKQAAATQAAARAVAVQIVAGRVSSGFGMRGGSMHAGMDIAAPIGTPIRVPLGGTVISSGPASGFGLWVRVRHADGTITVYGHINRSLVSVGQHVSAGQQIAEVGNRGQSTGPHLHLEVVNPAGAKINPRPWLDSHGFRYT